MPLYPYRCTQCGHKFEKIQSFSAEPETVCPKCGGKLERTLTAPRLNFKGAGWYVNDYAGKSSESSSDSSSGSGSSSSESKSSESKGSESKSESSTPAAPAAAPSAPASSTPTSTS